MLECAVMDEDRREDCSQLVGIYGYGEFGQDGTRMYGLVWACLGEARIT